MGKYRAAVPAVTTAIFRSLDIPYLVLATDTSIVALDMDGNSLSRSIAEENSVIRAVDCHYG